MKKKERLLLVSLLTALLWLGGCASEEYVSVNPHPYYYDWINAEMEHIEDTDRLILPYGPFLFEYRKITDYDLIVLSNILVDLP